MQKITLFIVSFLSFSLSASYETDRDDYARHYRIELPSSSNSTDAECLDTEIVSFLSFSLSATDRDDYARHYRRELPSSNGTDAEYFDTENAENDIFLNGSDHDRSSNGIDAECLDTEDEESYEENYDTFPNESDDESDLYADFSPETISALENAYEKFDRSKRHLKKYVSSRHIAEHLSTHKPPYTPSKTTQKSRKKVDLFSKSYDSPDLVGAYPLGKKTDFCTPSFRSKEESKSTPHFSGLAKSDAAFTAHYETLFLQVAVLVKK